MFSQSGKVSTGAFGWSAGLQGHSAKVGLLVVSDEILHTVIDIIVLQKFVFLANFLLKTQSKYGFQYYSDS